MCPKRACSSLSLGSRVFQKLGGLSYSWYLRHPPRLSIRSYPSAGKARPSHCDSSLCWTSLAIAWSTHSLIENPVRFHRMLVAKPTLSLALGAALTIGGLLAGTLSMTLGKRSATSPGEVEFLNAAANSDGNQHDCLTGFVETN